MDNKQIAKVFQEMGDILEIKGEGFFRVNAYRKGALTVENLAHDLRTVVEKEPETLDDIPGIGQALRDKIIELVKTGKCEAHEKLKKDFPKGLLEMLSLRGLGPKKVKLFYESLEIETIEQLKEAAEKGKLRELPKMGEKSEQEILKAIDEHSKFSSDRSLIHDALRQAERYIAYMKTCREVDMIQYAGSLRRMQETIGDVDILVGVDDPKEVGPKIMKHFTAYDEVINVIAEGDTKSSVILNGGLQTDLRVVEKGSFGAALHYFTGSKEHNIRVRDMAKKRGLKVNEYGLFKGDKKIAGETEESIFEALDLPFIEPEMRRNDGEFELEKQPKLVKTSDLKGDLHCHSIYSDGHRTIEEMAEAFIKQGYEYFAITDHSASMGITEGMDEKKIKKQWKEIDKLNEKFKGKIRILKGAEVDIFRDGSLDFSDKILAELDVVIASAHMHARLSAEEQTARLIKAIQNPHVNILGHPTGRLINRRAEMEFDMEAVISACVKNDVALEINASPMRLDLAEKYIRIAKEEGAKFVVDSDSHDTDQIPFIFFGVGMARRGWLTKNDVLNTKSLTSDLTLFGCKL